MRKGNELVPAAKMTSIRHHLRMFNKEWSDADARILTACISELVKVEQDKRNRPDLPRVQALRMGLVLLAEHLCQRYGCRYIYPVTVERRDGLYMQVPFLTMVAPYGMNTERWHKETDEDE